LAILARPASPLRTGLVAAMAIAFGVVLAVPQLRRFFALDLPSAVVVLAAIGVAAIGGALLELGWRLSGWVQHHQHLVGDRSPPARRRASRRGERKSGPDSGTT
jgi:cation-transporting ATPase E